MSNLNQYRCKSLAVTLLITAFILAAGPLKQANAATRLSQFGITWTFNGDYPTGQFANGDNWVVGPVTIVGIDPISVSGSRVSNGSMINPSPTNGTLQGYDSAMYGQYGPNYSNDLNAALNVSSSNPLVVKPGSSLVSTISIGSSGNRPQLETAAILTVLDAPAPEGSFRPQYCGGDKTVKFNKDQLNYALLAKLQPVANTPALSTIERKFERPWIDHVPTWMARYTHPAANMPDYGGDLCTDISEGAAMLQLSFSDQQIETLLVRYVQLGIDLYGITQDGGHNNWSPNGGHASGRKWPIIFAGLILGDYEMMQIGSGGMGNPYFGEDGQTFYVAQSDASSGRYSSSDIGLPEWGIRHATDPSMDNKSWAAPYRQCCTANNWAGVVLAARIMGARDLWNHNALFDYMDRYMNTEPVGTYTRQLSDFTESMWDAYRADYGGIWPDTTPPEEDLLPPLPPTDLTSNSQTDSSISLSWTPPPAASDGDLATGYRILRDNNLIATVSQAGYNDTSLAAETSYSYKVFSIDNANNLSTSPATGTFTTTEDTGNPPTPVNTYYISPDGSNSNDGLNWSTALRELPSTLKRDTTYFIAGGDYSYYNFDDPQSSTTIVIKKATSSDHGTDDGWNSNYASNQAVFNRIEFNDTSNIIIDGQTDNGIKIEYAASVQDGSRTLKIAGSNNIKVVNCEIDGNFTPGGSHSSGSCTLAHIENSSYITIQNCLMHDAADDGVQIRDSDHFYFYGNEIYGLYGCGTDGGCGPCSNGHSDGIEMYDLDDSEFIGNYIHNISSNAALFFGNWASSTDDYCNNILLANNIFYNNLDTGFTLYIEQADGVQLYNNTFWGRAGANYHGMSLGKYVYNLDMYNNIILSIDYNHIGGSYNSSNHRGDYNCFGVNLGQYGLKSNDIVASDPGFAGINGSGGPLITNVTRDDFKLKDTSPCIDAGTKIGPDTDIEGKTRPAGSAYDMGAYEDGDGSPPDPDKTPPTIKSVSAGENFLDIIFSEELSPETATDAANYKIDNSITVSAATLNAQNTVVTLQTSSHKKDTTYSLTVTGVTDTAGNVIAATNINYKFIQDTVGHWQFEETSGSTSEDLSGYGNTASLINGAAFTGDGSVQLNGQDDAVEVSMENMAVDAGSIVVRAQKNISEGLQYFFGHTVGTWTNNIQLYTNNGSLTIGLGNSHTTHENIAQLELNRSYHLALTWDGSDYAVYVDGVPAAQGSYSGLITLNTSADVGNNGNPSYRQENLGGIIDEASIYNYALTAEQVRQLAGPVNDNELIGHWQFAEDSGNSSADASENNNTASLINGPILTGLGEVSLDGADDAIEISGAQMNAGRGAVAAWVEPRIMSGYNYIFGHTTGEWNNKIQIYIDNGNLTIGLGDTHRLAANIQELAPETVYHIVLTWDGSTYLVYVNGQQKATGSYSGLSTIHTTADIGNNGDPAWRHEAFEGLISDVKIFNRNLTAKEVTDLSNEFKYGYEILMEMSVNWLGYSPGADIAPPGGDGVVNILDFLELSKHWNPQQQN